MICCVKLHFVLLHMLCFLFIW